MRKTKWACWAMIVLFGSSAWLVWAQDASVAEERKQWASITHRLEASPLDQNANKEGERADKQIAGTHDFHVTLCWNLFNELQGLPYTYQHVILRQYKLASATFQIENPDKVSDHLTTNLFALESIFKSYSAILILKPNARSKFLDDLIVKENEGKLADKIRGQCK